MLGLAMLEARAGQGQQGGGRRFGPDADARWRAFRGGLQDWHRIDVLVRDAAVRNPAGFAPRVIFDLPALADDEPCGPDWPGVEPVEAAGLLRQAGEGPPRDALTALEAAATAWGLRPARPPVTATADIRPATRLVLAGAGAVLAVAAAFAGRPELDLADQAVLVADDPGTRQLFGLALASLNSLGSRRPPRLLRTTATAEDCRALGIPAADRLLASDDVPPPERARVTALALALGVRL